MQARARIALLAGPALLLIGATVATHSVVRYELWIVVIYTCLTIALVTSVARRAPATSMALTWRVGAAAALALAGAGTVLVRAYTYLDPSPALAVRATLAGAAFAGAALLLLVRRGWAADAALGVAIVAYVAVAATLIRLDPAPRIDVWVTLQQGSDALWHGRNVYAQQWIGSPGIQDAFTYLPWTLVLLSPGRLLAGDVRWALVAVTVVAALAPRLLSGTQPTRRIAAAAAGALILLLPGTATQVEQAWTEPLLFACIAGWALSMQRQRAGAAVVFLALGLASKQHLVLVLPVLAAWPAFGPRRALASAGLAGALVLPWFVASPADMWHDTVTLLVHFPPLRFADTLYIAVLNELGWTLPFVVTLAAMVAAVSAAVVAVHRRRPGLDEVLRWCAVVLLTASLVNKQAFYNQYWLVMALILLSWALPSGTGAAAPDEPRSGASTRESPLTPPPVARPAGASA